MRWVNAHTNGHVTIRIHTRARSIEYYNATWQKSGGVVVACSRVLATHVQAPPVLIVVGREGVDGQEKKVRLQG